MSGNSASELNKYAPTRGPRLPNCGHTLKTRYRCSSVSLEDAKYLYKSYYIAPYEKEYQDTRLRELCVVSPKKTGPRKQGFDYIIIRSDGEEIPVCRTALTNILQITPYRLRQATLYS